MRCVAMVCNPCRPGLLDKYSSVAQFFVADISSDMQQSVSLANAGLMSASVSGRRHPMISFPLSSITFGPYCVEENSIIRIYSIQPRQSESFMRYLFENVRVFPLRNQNFHQIVWISWYEGSLYGRRWKWRFLEPHWHLFYCVLHQIIQIIPLQSGKEWL